MTNLLKAIGQTVWLITQLAFYQAQPVYRRIRASAPVYLRALTITTVIVLVIVPLLVLAKMITGWRAPLVAAAVIAVAATLAVGLLWTPLSTMVGLLRGRSLSAAGEAGSQALRFVGTMLFGEMMLTMYAWLVPFHNNIANIPLFLVALAALALGTAIWGGWLGGRFYTGVAAVVVAVLTLSFLLPKTFAAVGGEAGKIDQAMAASVLQPAKAIPPPPSSPKRVIQVQVRPDEDTDWITVPPGVPFKINAPGDLVYVFPRGEKIMVKNGERRLDLNIPANRFKLRGTAGIATITYPR